MLLNCGVGKDSSESLVLQEQVHPKGYQSWIFIGRTDAEAEAPVLWPLDAKNWLTGKDPDAGKDWRWEERGMAEDEMVGWHHQLNGYEFEQTPGVGDGQGSLACCSPWDCKKLDMTERLNWIELNSTPGLLRGFPGGTSGKEPVCQCRRLKRCRFDPWVRKIPWNRKRQCLTNSCQRPQFRNPGLRELQTGLLIQRPLWRSSLNFIFLIRWRAWALLSSSG